MFVLSRRTSELQVGGLLEAKSRTGAAFYRYSSSGKWLDCTIAKAYAGHRDTGSIVAVSRLRGSERYRSHGADQQ
jgi:hypothetical protein